MDATLSWQEKYVNKFNFIKVQSGRWVRVIDMIFKFRHIFFLILNFETFAAR